MSLRRQPLRAAACEPTGLVIGGSLGGLFAGNLQRRVGWDVDIFEHSAHDLDSCGGGIVLQPEVVEVAVVQTAKTDKHQRSEA
jgi:hypothetical protein